MVNVNKIIVQKNFHFLLPTSACHNIFSTSVKKFNSQKIENLKNKFLIPFVMPNSLQFNALYYMYIYFLGTVSIQRV